MDYNLVQQTTGVPDTKINVLILVVMDYSLVLNHLNCIIMSTKSLNPCCNGL